MKNKLIKVSLVFCSFFTVCALAGCNNPAPTPDPDPEPTPTPPGPTPVKDNKIVLSSPSNGTSFSIYDEKYDELYNAESEEETISVLEKNSLKNPTASSIKVTWDKNGSAYYVVDVSSSQTFTGEDTYSYKVSGLTPFCELYNLIPNRTYYWRVTGTKLNDVSDVRNFVTTGSSLRLITASGGKNMRDLGGYQAGEHTVKYGKIIRGNCINGYLNIARLDDDGLETFNNILKMNTEIDLRTSGSDDAGQNVNYFDATKPYIKATTAQYTSCFDYDVWKKVKAEDSLKVTGSASSSISAASIKKIFETLANEDSYPVYMHCNVGADRTGTMAFLINGLLGVSLDDLYFDYELTSYCSASGKRYRSAIDETGKAFKEVGVYQNGNGNFVAMKAFADALVKYYGYEGASLADTIKNYLMSYAGISLDTLVRVKQNLLDGYKPSEEGGNVISLKSARQKVYLNNATFAISLDDVQYDKINGVTFNGQDLGNDITNLNTTNIPKTKSGETYLIVNAIKDGEPLYICVPVLLVTDVITTYQQLHDELMFKNEPITGYYELGNDIGDSSTMFKGDDYGGSLTTWDDSLGLQGTFDGCGHTISGQSARFGIFGVIGKNGLVKNLKVNNYSYQSGSGHEHTTLGASILGGKLQNVEINILSGPTSRFNEITEYRGAIFGYYTRYATLNDVTFNAEGYYIDSVLGGTPSSGYLEGTCTFNGFEVNAKEVQSLGHAGSKWSYIEDLPEASGEVNSTCEASNLIKVKNGVGTIFFGSRYESFSLSNLKYEGKPIEDYVYLEGEVAFDLEGLITDDDAGERTFTADLTSPKGLLVHLTVPVTIKNSYDEIIIGTENKIIYQDTSTYKLDIGEYDLPEYRDNITAIKYKDYNLGTDLDHLNLTFIDDFSKHGNLVINVFVIQPSGAKYQLVVSAKIITKLIYTMADLRASIDCYSASQKVIYGYYCLENDIGTQSDELNSKSSANIDVWKYDGTTGFRGTFNGQGHTITGQSKYGSYGKNGLFGMLGSGAMISNLNIVDHHASNNTMECLIASTIYEAYFLNVNITLKELDGTTLSGQRGFISSLRMKKTTFNNLVIDAKGVDLGSIFGGNSSNNDFNSNVFINSTIMAKSALTFSNNGEPTGQYYQCVDDFDSHAGVTFIKD